MNLSLASYGNLQAQCVLSIIVKEEYSNRIPQGEKEYSGRNPQSQHLVYCQ